jgi:hypothetical protein
MPKLSQNWLAPRLAWCLPGGPASPSPSNHVLDLFAVQLPHVMVQLAGKWEQQTAAGLVDHDLAQQVTRQRLRQRRAGTPSTSAEDSPVPILLAQSSAASCPAIPACNASSTVRT